MSVSTSVGPISGIDYGKLITGLTAIEQQPIDLITARLSKLDQQNTALLGVSTLLTGLRLAAASFTSTAVFRAATATSANTGIVNATAGTGTPSGNYSFNVQRLAASSQQVTQGFSSSTAPLGLSGNITLQLGGGTLDDAAKLTSLNGGNGVARGSIRVTDRSGASTLIDLTHAVDINDVVNTINSATGVNVIAKADNDKLVISDNTGGGGTLSITNAGGTTTASDLGLTGAAVGGTLTGASLTALNGATSLNALNDGNGVRNAGGSTDFSITGAGGTANVSISGAKTLSDLITTINTAGQSAGLSAAISSDGHGITLTDAGGGPVTVAAQNNSLAAYDLGIQGTGSGGSLVGDRVAGGLTGPLLRNLNGGNQGQGATLPSFGTITINSQTIDLSGARSLNDALTTINTNTQGVTAALNDSGTGLTLTSSAGSFTVADGTGNLASYLHIAGTSTATATGSKVDSGDLRLRYIAENTRLSTLNGGAGVKAGSIKITAPAASTGNPITAVTLDLSAAATVGDVISRINSAGLALTARINDTGDGILLTQTAGSTGAKIEEANGGTTASGLGIAGTLSNNTLDGTFRKTVSVASTDTLSDISSKINSAGAGVAVTIINDGSGTSPFRLNLSSRNSGLAGRVIFNGAGAGLTTTSLVKGQDAAIVYGGNANGTGGLLATSSTNVLSSLVPGLTVNLTGVGTTTVSVTNDTSKISDAVQNFVDSYNKVVTNVATVTNYDSTNATNNGVLFGDSSIQQVQDALGGFLTKSYTNAGPYRNLAAVGITVGQDGTLTLNTDKLNTALATDPADIQTLFTTNIKAVTGGQQFITNSTSLSTLNSGTTFPAGHISITDGFGAAHDIDLTAAKTISDVIAAINTGSGGTVSAGINGTGDGLALTQVGGSGDASVAEVNGGTSAAFLNIKGTFASGILSNSLPFLTAKNAVKGVGGTLSDLLDRFTNAQTGLLFDATTSIQSQETQLKDRQQALSDLVAAKKNRLVLQFANLEVTIAGLQNQGNALANFKPITTTSSSSS